MIANRVCQCLAAFALACVIMQVPASAQTPAPATIHSRANIDSTTIGTFTGGDPGEGLDLSGSFLHAVNFDGTVANQQVGDALFVDVAASSLGVAASATLGTLSAGHGLAPDYGTSTNDDALEAVMASSHTGTGNAFNTMVLPGLVEGTPYKLQLLMNDPYSDVDREFDIRLPSLNAHPSDAIIDSLSPQQHQGYFGSAAGGPVTGDVNLGVVVTVEWTHPTGAGTDLNIGMDNYGQLPPVYGAANVQPVIAGLTLEVVPEPACFSLLATSAVALLLYRRRR